MEITQFTYFQQMTGIECKPVPVEITYGLERLCMFVQGKNNVFDLDWNEEELNIKKFSSRPKRNFLLIILNLQTQILYLKILKTPKMSVNHYLRKLSLPAYDQCLKASHIFNLLDARGVIGVAERTGYITRIRELAKGCGTLWLSSQG